MKQQPFVSSISLQDIPDFLPLAQRHGVRPAFLAALVLRDFVHNPPEKLVIQSDEPLPDVQ